VFTAVVSLWMVFALSLASGIVISVDNPARQSFYVEMVGEGTLTNAVSLNSAAFTGARIIGPAVAGILIATVGMAICFLIDGISYLAVLTALLAMHGAELHAQRRSTRERGHLVAGLRYVWETDALRRPLLMMAVVFTFVFEWQVLVPLLANHTFHAGPGAFGLLSAAAGLGSFIGAILAANRNERPSMHGLGVWLAAVGVTMALVSVAPTLPVAMVLMVPIGFFAMSVHDHGQHDAPAGGQTAGARARDGAVRGGLPGLDADRGATGRLARRDPRRAPDVPRRRFARGGRRGRGPGEPVRLPRHPRRDDRRTGRRPGRT
jgi:MFS family permease